MPATERTAGLLLGLRSDPGEMLTLIVQCHDLGNFGSAESDVPRESELTKLSALHSGSLEDVCAYLQQKMCHLNEYVQYVSPAPVSSLA